MTQKTREPERFVPSALTVARTFRSLTVSDLAEQAGLSRQLVSSIESGAIGPFSAALGALADTLRVPLEFLYQETPIPEPGVLHFRMSSRVRERSVLRARSFAGMFARVVGACSSYARFAPLRIHSATPSSDDAIELAAETFRQKLGLRLDTPIGNAIKTVEASGAFVAMCDVEGVPVDGFCWANGTPLIVLSQASPWSRRRFSAFHEMGHVALHGRSRPEDMEAQANRFAGAVLAPRAVFWREFPRTGSRLDWAALVAMKQRWGVSLQALVRRAFDLQIINAAQYRTANIHVRSVGWKLDEPGEQVAEEPEMCARFMAALSARGALAPLSKSARLYRANIEEILGISLPETESRINQIIELAGARKNRRPQPVEEPSS